MKHPFRIPVLLSVFTLAVASCGGGGGGSTPPMLSVRTDNATSISQNGAVLNGTANGNGITGEAWFEYGTNPTLAAFDNTPVQQVDAGSVDLSLSHPLTGLTPGTTYFYRLVGWSIDGFVEGAIVGFNTRNPPPNVTTGDPTFLSLNGATLNGLVNPNGGDTTAWFEYGQDPDPVSFTATDNQSLGFGRDPVPVESPLSGLLPGTIYYFRLVAESVEGRVAGEIKPFSTGFPPPTATTGIATNITTTGATLNGTFNPNGFLAEVWFEFGMDPTLGSFAETTHQFPPDSGSTDVPVPDGIAAPLVPWRTYYFRLVAQSVEDPSMFTKGQILSFPTGEYYVALGDSITEAAGGHDDIPSDGIGYEPILEDRLTQLKGYPHTVANEGQSGETSAGGAARINFVLSQHPDAKFFLILYGTNDALSPVSKATFEANIETIILAVLNAGKTPYLAKVPYTDDPFRSIPSIQEYNTAIDELVLQYQITVTPPDFFTWFFDHPGELDDGVHPNGTGYQSMAKLWSDALTAP